MNLGRTLEGLRRRVQQQRDAIAERQAVIEAIRADARFRTGLDELAASHDLEPTRAAEDADRYLDEMVTVHSKAFPDFNLLLAKVADRRGFEGAVQYDEDTVERLHAISETSPLVMMTAHRSYMDFVVRLPFAQRGFERDYRFAGANILFWPMGPIGHSVGIIFVRRGFRDPVYSFVLRQYVGWLTENKTNFLWAIEGGRTRTGKLLQPKVGLLAYVAQAYADGRGPDVTMVPTTVVYEYLNEVFEYARYGRGASKSGESLLSFLPFWRQQRRVPFDARINLGIGEPVSLGSFVQRGGDAEATSAGITQAALEVCRRIDAATPITPVALVLLPLLEHQDVRMTVDEIAADLAPVLQHIARRKLPAAEPGAGTADGVRRALELLREQGLVAVDGSGSDQHYAVAPGRHVEAAYHRNAIVHFFAVRSIAEIALVRAAAASPGDRVATFWAEVERLRDLLAHEFFFPEDDAFLDAIRIELAAAAADWESTVEAADGTTAVLEAMRPVMAPRTLAPFLDAFKVVADGLGRLGSKAVDDERRFASDCLARAQLDLAVGRLRRPDVASLNMFDTPLAAARRRGLLDAGSRDARQQLAATIDDALVAISELEERDGRVGVREPA